MGTFPFVLYSQAVILTSNPISEYITLNTLFGAIVVLAALFLIMIITYFVRIKPSLLDNSNEDAVKHNSSVDNAIAQIVGNEEGELTGDSELVAVITAAIYASMQDSVPADGFVVRSIRKVNAKKWMNA
jgi:hypothetical protein